MNQADILAEKVLDDVLEETVIEMQRWVISMQFSFLNDYKIKRKQRSSVLLKVALLWLSSEYGGRGVGGGQSTEKVFRCVMRRREGPVFCL